MQTYKILEGNKGGNLYSIGYGECFLDVNTKDMIHEEIIDKLDFIKIVNFCSVKDNVKRIRKQATDWENIFTKVVYDKGLLSHIYKEHIKLNKKNTNSPIIK